MARLWAKIKISWKCRHNSTKYRKTNFQKFQILCKMQLFFQSPHLTLVFLNHLYFSTFFSICSYSSAIPDLFSASWTLLLTFFRQTCITTFIPTILLGKISLRKRKKLIQYPTADLWQSQEWAQVCLGAEVRIFIPGAALYHVIEENQCRDSIMDRWCKGQNKQPKEKIQ